MSNADQSSAWPLFALLVVAAAALVVLQMRRPQPPDPHVGQPLPPLDVAGWINTDRPLVAGDLRGKLLVVDYWATWCGPCIASMPKMVDLHQRFGDQGLHIVGFTSQTYAERDTVEQYVRSVEGLDWPIAYDAGFVFDMMGIYGIPTYVLYDGSGLSVWAGSDVDDLEDAVVAALARSKP